MKVSVMTPTANRKHLFDIAVRMMVNQDWVKEGKEVEWVIVEDGDDDVQSLLTDLPANIHVKYVRLDGKHPIGKKRNQCLKEASGDILLFHDDDDIYPSTHISYCVECLTSQHNFGVLGSSATLVYNTQRDKFYLFGRVCENHTPCGHLAFTRKALKQYGMKFRNKDTYGEEKYFLQEFRIPLFFKDFRKSVIAIQHGKNTWNVLFDTAAIAPDMWENDEQKEFIYSKFTQTSSTGQPA
jgi:glycosyltransferase involved in cell wall biosynthesis